MDRTIGALGLASLGLAVVAAAIATNYCFGYSLLPTTDQWRIVDRLLTQPALEFVFSEHNGHRIALTNFSIFLDYNYFSWRNTFTFLVGAGFLLASLAMLFFLLSPLSRRGGFAFLSLTVAIYFISLNWRNIWDVTQSVAVHGLLFFTACAALALRRGMAKGTGGYIWLSAAFGIPASLSFSYGLLIPFLGAFAFLWMRRFVQGALLFVLAACYAIWEMLPQITSLLAGGGNAAASPLEQLSLLPVSVLATLGLPFRAYVPPDAALAGVPLLPTLGLLLLALFLLLLVACLRREGVAAAAPWLALMAVSLGSGCLIFAGRASSTSLAETVALAAAPRYFMASYLGLLAILGLGLAALDRAPRGIGRGATLLATAGAIALSVLTLIDATPMETRFARNYLGRYAGSYMLFLSGDSVSTFDKTREAVRDARIRVIDRISDTAKGPFSRAERDFIGRPVAELGGDGPVKGCEASRIGPVKKYAGAEGEPPSVFLYGQAAPSPHGFLGGMALLSDESDARIASAGVTGLQGRNTPRFKQRADYAGFLLIVPNATPEALGGRAVYLRPDEGQPFCRVTVPPQ